ncbi:MAG: pectin acetylesterase-family hydrolase, partial [Proteobacteria bacterium]|nr:pectin acetylesterase-family hydrolase [Pseudomonadota bacterium]
MVLRRLRMYLAFCLSFMILALSSKAVFAEAAQSWEWFSVDGAQCRDGSEAGFFLRRRPFDNRLVIYLEGGGACFNSLTCAASPASVGDQFPGNEGIFRERDDNPVSAWNFVHVPYCTGDIFAGTKTGVSVPGVRGKQNFVGFLNVQKILHRLHEMMPDVEEILLTGVSAGGFGADFHYAATRAQWPMTKVVLFDDSGIPLEDEWLSPCLQQNFRKLWGMNAALPADCPECKSPNGGGLVEMVGWLRRTYADAQIGTVMSNQDNTLRFFYGFGLNECHPPLIPSISAKNYKAAISSLKDHYLSDGISSFIWDSTQHTFIGGKSFYASN